MNFIQLTSLAGDPTFIDKTFVRAFGVIDGKVVLTIMSGGAILNVTVQESLQDVKTALDVA